MENLNKKDLDIQAAVLNLSCMQEQVLASYRRVRAKAALALVSPRAQQLMAQYGMELQTASTQLVPEGCQLAMQNGTAALQKGQTVSQPTVLVVNGTLTLHPDCQDALESYAAVQVNGELVYPMGMEGMLGRIQVNGSRQAYRPDAVLLDKITLDRTFLLRAAQGAKYDAAKLVALEENVDWSLAASKQLDFRVEKAVLRSSAMESLLGCINPEAKVVEVPDGMFYTRQNQLDKGLVLQSRRIFADGNFAIDAEQAPLAARLEQLTVTGTLRLDERLADWAEKAAVKARRLELVDARGDCLEDIGCLEISRAMLEQAEFGLRIEDCASVEFDEDIPPELLREKIRSIHDCASVEGTAEQLAAVRAVCRDVADISARTPSRTSSRINQRDLDTVRITAASYTL